ncbi:Protein Phosphatase Slingshot 2 [Manis pentadactyla]|nr:Protein Phosphatase Slingshot 2 [Manis pentadactyla]
MEHGVMACGIAGPNPCHNLRASGVLQLLWESGPTGGTLAQGDYAPSSDGNHSYLLSKAGSFEYELNNLGVNILSTGSL